MISTLSHSHTKFQAIEAFLSKPKNHDIGKFGLSEADLEVLNDLRSFLLIPHTVQELLSAERTPTLCQVIPAYEKLIDILEGAESAYSRIGHVVRAARQKLEEYFALSRNTRAYAVAMSTCFFYCCFAPVDDIELVISPLMKTQWMREHWTTLEGQVHIEEAEKHVREAVSKPFLIFIAILITKHRCSNTDVLCAK
jgi:hypothetical protein